MWTGRQVCKYAWCGDNVATGTNEIVGTCTCCADNVATGTNEIVGTCCEDNVATGTNEIVGTCCGDNVATGTNEIVGTPQLRYMQSTYSTYTNLGYLYRERTTRSIDQLGQK